VLIAAVTLWWAGRTHADFYVMFISALARVFTGDTGSQFLGLTLAAVSLLLPLVALAGLDSKRGGGGGN
jgi:UDP-N-acetylmuramyl pentapeptide phosphotransferase/UDP-N-acetylglucosamine-1-phosphate transferase